MMAKLVLILANQNALIWEISFDEINLEMIPRPKYKEYTATSQPSLSQFCKYSQAFCKKLYLGYRKKLFHK